MSIKGDGGGNVVSLVDRPLSPTRSMERCRTLWKEGKFTWVRHAEERLSALGWDITDVENMIRYGRVIEHSKPGDFWRYKLEGPNAERQTGGLAYEFHGELLVLVSVMMKGKWRN